MKRDMDIVRRILLKAEEMSEEQGYDMFSLDGTDDAGTWAHVELLKEAGLVDAHILRTAGPGIHMARIFRLTWAGHDFLEAIRNDTIWAKTKTRITEQGVGWTLELVKAVAVAYGKQLLMPDNTP
jgi:hypothetical protein